MWVAREYTGELNLWEHKPHRHFDNPLDEEECWWESDGSVWIGLDESLFPNLKWEDEPLEVELIPKQNGTAR